MPKILSPAHPNDITKGLEKVNVRAMVESYGCLQGGNGEIACKHVPIIQKMVKSIRLTKKSFEK